MKTYLARIFLTILIALMAGCVPGSQTATSVPLTPTAISVKQTPTREAAAIATVTPGATATVTPEATPTTPIESAEGWLAYLENGQITIHNLSMDHAINVEGRYQRLAGWSPNRVHLLANRNDGASVVIDRSGAILAAFDDLPQPAFWATPNAEGDGEDWLAVPRADAALELVSFPSGKSTVLFEPGSLGADGQAFLRWGSNGKAILGPSLAQLQNDVAFPGGILASMSAGITQEQLLFIEGTGGRAVSQDFKKRYFHVLDSVPGSPLSILLGFFIDDECSACLIDGLELTSLDSWSLQEIPLGVTLFDTPETYAWNPAQPGLLALAAGGLQSTLENKRLALLDVPAGTMRYLTGADETVFEPSWSPDGRRLAYTTMPALPGTPGSEQELEALMGERAIAVYDLETETKITVTRPAEDEFDGWPRWIPDVARENGARQNSASWRLLFARKRLTDSSIQVRLLDLATGEERLIVSISGASQSCHQAGCGWEQILSYTMGLSAETRQQYAPVLAPTPTAIVKVESPQPGMNTYINTAYGFSFQYPSTWQLEEGLGELPNYILLKGEKGVLIIGHRRATQQAAIQRTGTGAGDFVPAGSIQFLGKTLRRDLLVYGGKVKEVFYQSDCEFSVGNLVFTLGLNNTAGPKYEDADIPQETQEEADQILESFQWVEGSN